MKNETKRRIDVAANSEAGGLFRRSRPAKISREELKALSMLLESSDTSLIRFGNAVSSHPAVLQYLLRAANSSLTGSVSEITDATRATLYLGTRRVLYLLDTLPAEMIEEENAEKLPTA
jgi:HD-like signal output (HDOD) protein